MLGIAVIVALVVGLQFLIADVDIDNYKRGRLPFGLSFPAVVALGLLLLMVLSFLFKKK